MRLTNKVRRRLIKAVQSELWDAATKAQVIACIERMRGQELNLDIPDYNGDAPFFDPNAVVVQAIDYFYGIGTLRP